jgi:hypothetical protein
MSVHSVSTYTNGFSLCRERDISSPSSDDKDKRSSSADSSSSDDSLKLLVKLQEARLEKAGKRQADKAKAKALETPEEKRARRLYKKDMKERRRKENMGWDSEILHYTNADNPFGDSHLLDTFMWKKKLEKEGLSELPIEELETRKRQKMEENKVSASFDS